MEAVTAFSERRKPKFGRRHIEVYDLNSRRFDSLPELTGESQTPHRLFETLVMKAIQEIDQTIF